MHWYDMFLVGSGLLALSSFALIIIVEFTDTFETWGN